MNQLPETAIGTLQLMPSTAVEVGKFAHQIIKSVKNGDVDPLKIQVMMRAIEALAKEVVEEIQEEVLREAEKNPEKKFNAYGSIIEKAEVGTKYNFLVCKDPTYERLEVDFETAKRKLDERKELLKKLSEPTPLGDTVTGELVTVNPPLKTSKSGVKVYLSNIK